MNKRAKPDLDSVATAAELSSVQSAPGLSCIAVSAVQALVGERHLGGFDDVNALDRAGELDAILNGESESAAAWAEPQPSTQEDSCHVQVRNDLVQAYPADADVRNSVRLQRR